MIIALLVGCALRRQELASLNIEAIQLREGRWVIIDLHGKGGRICTVAIPIWVKQGIDAWTAAAKIDKGRLLRPISKSGKIVGDELGDWAIWSVVEQSSKQSESSTSARMTCAELVPNFAARAVAISSKSSFSWGTRRFRPRSVISDPSRRLRLQSMTASGCRIIPDLEAYLRVSEPKSETKNLLF